MVQRSMRYTMVIVLFIDKRKKKKKKKNSFTKNKHVIKI